LDNSEGDELLSMKLLAEYRKLHAEDAYSEDSLFDVDINVIEGLVAGTKSKTVLDFGCGQATQYTAKAKHRRFGVGDDDIFGYDPAVTGRTDGLNRLYDGVISTDVLEHIPEDEIDDVLRRIFSLATNFVYIAVFCGKAKTRLSDGTNAHVTIKPSSWWRTRFDKANVRDIPAIYKFRVPVA
jgi:hypothetical protein